MQQTIGIILSPNRNYLPLLKKVLILATFSLPFNVQAVNPPPNIIRPGCEYKNIDIEKYGKQPFQNPPEIISNKGVLDTKLTVQYTVRETTSIGGCPVNLRSFNGQLVGPTLRIKQGDTIKIHLQNQLPIETQAEIDAQFAQENSSAFLSTTPASFNTTNMHYHGMHVSPEGHSDNVLLAIAPGTPFDYKVAVPSTHPIGTYWYHPHAHGSTSIQVGSGMAGALIVEDNPASTPKALLDANKGEKILVFQTILYNENGELNQIGALFPSPNDPTPENCTGANKNTWSCAKRRTTINGQIVPVITMKSGDVQRWRLIGSAFRESVMFNVQGHDLHEIALDGNYLGHIDTWKAGSPIDIEPGYRSDILIKAGKPGEYKILDGASPANKSLRAVAEPETVLAILKVTDEVKDMALPANAEMAVLAPFGNTDLSKTADAVQEVVYKLGSAYSANDNRNYFQVNYKAFSHTNIRKLGLNATDLWTLTTVGDHDGVPPGGGVPNGKGHPNETDIPCDSTTKCSPPPPHVFHIHVNPFQYERKGPDGKDELVWKDTLLVQGPQVTKIFTKYTDFKGKFVMHCHILDHEDLGMMEIQEVVDPADLIEKPDHH